MEIKIRYISDIEPLTKIEKGDCIDLRSAIDIHLEAGNFYKIPLGIAMQLPVGYEAHVYPRSSSFNKWGIIQTNSVGIIDNSYCGNNDEWSMPVFATKDADILKNDRICQFRIVEKQPSIDFVAVEELDNPNRGGFGSTGTR